jgi:hypothetical protein
VLRLSGGIQPFAVVSSTIFPFYLVGACMDGRGGVVRWGGVQGSLLNGLD